MLCDEIIRANGVTDPTYPPPVMRTIVANIKRATKFVLAEDFAAVADELADNLTEVVKAMPFMRLPFPVTWIEVAQSHRPRFLTAGIHMPEAQKQPQRVGYLLTATRDDLSAWKTHLFWNFPESVGGGFSSTSPVAVEFDMSRPFDQIAPEHDYEGLRRQYAAQGLPLPPQREGWDKLAQQTKVDICAAVQVVPADCFPMMPPGVSPDEWAKMIGHLARLDWSGEYSYIEAALAMLNARNASESVLVDKTEHNRKRAKQGKPPMASHYMLRIHPRQKAKIASINLAQHHAELRAHFVRGHWKVRKSGIYFWRPFMRGDRSKGEIQKGYEVRN